ncbi:hypothetical protein ACG04R_26140 [Roseateles sp. BYS78W]|uniref:Uncharacterized protein n=1 Tax=Pelomonas candidula TaxID=3299025 RepID=A0ABW7HK84_9BURK
MNGLLIVATGLVLGVVLAQAYASLRIHQLRKQGIYPQQGQASDADVMRLLKSGYKVEAIRCHRDVHQTSLRAAKQAVESLVA